MSLLMCPIFVQYRCIRMNGVKFLLWSLEGLGTTGNILSYFIIYYFLYFNAWQSGDESWKLHTPSVMPPSCQINISCRSSCHALYNGVEVEPQWAAVLHILSAGLVGYYCQQQHTGRLWCLDNSQLPKVCQSEVIFCLHIGCQSGLPFDNNNVY